MPTARLIQLGASLDSQIEKALAKAEALNPQFATRAKELLQLENNWDDEGAEAIRPIAILTAVSLAAQLNEQFGNFQIPHLAPTRSGSVIIEWGASQKFLELEFSDEAWFITGTLRNQQRILSGEAPVGADLSKFYRWLSSDAENW